MFPCRRDKKRRTAQEAKKGKEGRFRTFFQQFSKQETKVVNETSLQDLEELTKDLPSLRFKEFSDKFSFAVDYE